MTTVHYNRSQILSYYELTEDQQLAVMNDYCLELFQAGEESFVLCNEHVIPLGMFTRIENSKVWHGSYATSAFTGYLIRINRTNEFALVAMKQW